MLNVVMLVKNRPKLTHQSLYTLAKHTDIHYNVTIIDDGSDSQTQQILSSFALRKNVAVLSNLTSKGIVGQARNLGVYWAEKYWGRGDWLYLSDNDVYFTDGWASKLVSAFDGVNRKGLGFSIIGGQNHPFHQPLATYTCNPEGDDGISTVHEHNAVAGTSQLMEWGTWDRFGPQAANAPGVCQSEDTDFCNRIRSWGWRVGAVSPHVVYDCGISQTDGSPSIGADVKVQRKGVLYL